MIPRLGRRSGALAALLAALAALVPAGAAHAADPGPQITIDRPAADDVSPSSAVDVGGKAATDLAIYQMKDIVLAVGDQTTTITCTSSPCPFTWKPTFPANGPYQLKVTATERALLLGTPSTGVQTRSFAVAAPPAKPVLDAPRITDGRTVELTWTRNAEPDILYYAVFRKDPAATKALQVGGKIPQPPAPAKTVSFTDTTTAFNGGDFGYQVVAVRKGASGAADTEAKSEPSLARVATVPAPPTTTSVAPLPGAPVTPGANPTTTVKPGTSAGVDLSGFLASRPPPKTLTPLTVPELPDTGFNGTLPFGARPPGSDQEEGDQQAVAPKEKSTSIISAGSAGRPLVPIAGGLILLLLAMHMRILNRRIKPAPASGDLPVDLHAPARGKAAAKPGPAPTPVVKPARKAKSRVVPTPIPVVKTTPDPDAAFFDIVEQANWAAEPEPRPEPVGRASASQNEALWAPPVKVKSARVPPIKPPVKPAAPAEPNRAPIVAANGEIEVFDVVAPTRRRLVRSGGR